MFKNLGENQVMEIIKTAKTSVFFIDEAQKVTWSDVGEISMIEEQAKLAGAIVERLELTSQFRCSGSDDYMAWLDETLGNTPNKPALIFMHHPPLALGLSQQDANMLEDHETFFDALARNQNNQ